MFRSISLAVICSICLLFLTNTATAQQAFGQHWATANAHQWQRFYHYPYVYYPHNFHPPAFYQSRPDLYHRYPAEMRVPAFNRQWINFFPQQRRFHTGNHFRLDIF